MKIRKSGIKKIIVVAVLIFAGVLYFYWPDFSKAEYVFYKNFYEQVESLQIKKVKNCRR